MSQIRPTITQGEKGDWLYVSESPLNLERGGTLCRWQLCYETWGELSPDKDNVVVIHHALSVGAHVTSSDANPDKGWWQEMVGPGRAIDTDRFFVICINNLGSCFGFQRGL